MKTPRYDDNVLVEADPEHLQPSPGVDDLIESYEALEEVYWFAVQATPNLEENGITTNYTDFPRTGCS